MKEEKELKYIDQKTTQRVKEIWGIDASNFVDSLSLKIDFGGEYQSMSRDEWVLLNTTNLKLDQRDNVSIVYDFSSNKTYLLQDKEVEINNKPGMIDTHVIEKYTLVLYNGIATATARIQLPIIKSYETYEDIKHLYSPQELEQIFPKGERNNKLPMTKEGIDVHVKEILEGQTILQNIRRKQLNPQWKEPKIMYNNNAIFQVQKLYLNLEGKAVNCSEEVKKKINN